MPSQAKTIAAKSAIFPSVADPGVFSWEGSGAKLDCFWHGNATPGGSSLAGKVWRKKIYSLQV